MSTEHTQGRLIVKNDYGLFKEDGETAIGCAIWLKDGADKAKANARRLAACWNACEMASTEDLEALTRPGDVSWACTIDRVVRERDELLKALKRIEGATMSMYATKAAMLDDIQEIAFAAITKSEGSAA